MFTWVGELFSHAHEFLDFLEQEIQATRPHLEASHEALQRAQALDFLGPSACLSCPAHVKRMTCACM